MFLATIAILILLCLILYKIQGKMTLSVQQIAYRIYFIIMYYIMGARESVEDLINRSGNKTDYVDKTGEVAVITGGSRGIGLEVVKKLLKCKFQVIIGCRNIEAGNLVLQSLQKLGLECGNSKCYQLDISSLTSIKRFAETILENHPQIDLLVNNAGVMITPHEVTEDGFELQFVTNYLGHCYLSHLLLPRLAASGRHSGLNTRIVNVTSCIHYMGSIYFDDLVLSNGYLSIMAYGQSKLAQVLFTKLLDSKLKAAGMTVQVHAVHPGIVNTEIFNGSLLTTCLPWIPRIMFRDAEEGARSILHACVSPRLTSRGGTYITNCNISQAGGKANYKDIQEQLWDVMMKLLKLETFGGLKSQNVN